MSSAQWVAFGYITFLALLWWIAWKVSAPMGVEHDRSKYYQQVGEKLVALKDCQDYWEFGGVAKTLHLATRELQEAVDYFMSHGWVDARWTGAGPQMTREYFVTQSGWQRFNPPPEPAPTLQPTNAV